ncbi:MAG TPA: hypothetical protein VE032_03035 [Actinomycetota bacterium]|nr:hypothetical protein [Actinomycetota bacterium]
MYLRDDGEWLAEVLADEEQTSPEDAGAADRGAAGGVGLGPSLGGPIEVMRTEIDLDLGRPDAMAVQAEKHFALADACDSPLLVDPSWRAAAAFTATPLWPSSASLG